MRDPVRQFGLPYAVTCNVFIEAKPPGDVATLPFRFEGRQIGRITLELGHVGEEAFGDQGLSIPPDNGRDVVQTVLGMVLDTPERATAETDFRGLNLAHRIARGNDRTLRKAGDDVAVNGRCIEHGLAVRMHGVVAAGSGQRDLARESDLSSGGVEANLPSGRDRCKL